MADEQPQTQAPVTAAPPKPPAPGTPAQGYVTYNFKGSQYKLPAGLTDAQAKERILSQQPADKKPDDGLVEYNFQGKKYRLPSGLTDAQAKETILHKNLAAPEKEKPKEMPPVDQLQTHMDHLVGQARASYKDAVGAPVGDDILDASVAMTKFADEAMKTGGLFSPELLLATGEFIAGGVESLGKSAIEGGAGVASLSKSMVENYTAGLSLITDKGVDDAVGMMHHVAERLGEPIIPQNDMAQLGAEFTNDLTFGMGKALNETAQRAGLDKIGLGAEVTYDALSMLLPGRAGLKGKSATALAQEAMEARARRERPTQVRTQAEGILDETAKTLKAAQAEHQKVMADPVATETAKALANQRLMQAQAAHKAARDTPAAERATAMAAAQARATAEKGESTKAQQAARTAVIGAEAEQARAAYHQQTTAAFGKAKGAIVNNAKLSPEQSAKMLAEVANQPLSIPVPKNVTDVADALHLAEANYSAHSMLVNNLINHVRKFKPTLQELENIQHYEENKDHKLSARERDIYEQGIKPLGDAAFDAYKYVRENGYPTLGPGEVPRDKYTVRVPVRKADILTRMKSKLAESPGVQGGGPSLSRSLGGSEMNREMFALVDREGNRTVVQFNKSTGRTTAWKDGKPTDIGSTKGRFTDQKMASLLMEPIEAARKRLGLKLKEVNRILAKSGQKVIDLRDGLMHRLSAIDDQRELLRYLENTEQRIRDLENRIKGVEMAGPGVTELHPRFVLEIQRSLEELKATRDLIRTANDIYSTDYGVSPRERGQQARELNTEITVEQAKLRENNRILAKNKIDRRLNELNQQLEEARVRLATEFMTRASTDEIRVSEARRQVLESQVKALNAAVKAFNPVRSRAVELMRQAARLAGKEAEIDRLFSDLNRQDGSPLLFKDNEGKVWRVDHSNIREIESHSPVRYHKSVLAARTVNTLNVLRAKNSVDIIESLKKSSFFDQYAVKPGAEIGVDDPRFSWKGVDGIPGFRDWKFEPKLREVLQDFADRSFKDPSALQKLSKGLVSTMFLIPLPHIANVAVHAAVERGLPAQVKIPQRMRYLTNGLLDVWNQSPLYIEVARRGGSLMHAKYATGEMMANALQDLRTDLVADKTLSAKIAKFTNPVDFYTGWLNRSNKILWAANDVYVMAAIREKMQRGLSLDDAIQKVETHIPNYRVPSRLFANAKFQSRTDPLSVGLQTITRGAAKVHGMPAVSVFGAYHYGMWKSYAHMMTDLIMGEKKLSKQDLGKRLEALSHALTLGYLTYIVYPALDKAAQATTGNQAASVTRSGASRLPFMIGKYARGETQTHNLIFSAFTPAPPLLFAASMANIDFMTGRKISDFDNMARDPMDYVMGHLLYSGQFVYPAQQTMQMFTRKRDWADVLALQFLVDLPSEERQDQQEEAADRREAIFDREKDQEDEDLSDYLEHKLGESR